MKKIPGGRYTEAQVAAMEAASQNDEKEADVAEVKENEIVEAAPAADALSAHAEQEKDESVSLADLGRTDPSEVKDDELQGASLNPDSPDPANSAPPAEMPTMPPPELGELSEIDASQGAAAPVSGLAPTVAAQASTSSANTSSGRTQTPTEKRLIAETRGEVKSRACPMCLTKNNYLLRTCAACGASMNAKPGSVQQTAPAPVPPEEVPDPFAALASLAAQQAAATPPPLPPSKDSAPVTGSDTAKTQVKAATPKPKTDDGKKSVWSHATLFFGKVVAIITGADNAKKVHPDAKVAADKQVAEQKADDNPGFGAQTNEFFDKGDGAPPPTGTKPATITQPSEPEDGFKDWALVALGVIALLAICSAFYFATRFRAANAAEPCEALTSDLLQKHFGQSDLKSFRPNGIAVKPTKRLDCGDGTRIVNGTTLDLSEGSCKVCPLR